MVYLQLYLLADVAPIVTLGALVFMVLARLALSAGDTETRAPVDPVLVRVALPTWPTVVRVAPTTRSLEGRVLTHDHAFDRVVAVHGPQRIWRPLLTADVRLAIRELLELGARIENLAAGAQVTFRGDARDFDAIADKAMSLAAMIGKSDARPLDRLFAAARAEPNRDVRWAHYRWLAMKRVYVAAVYRAAAVDADPEIRDWGRMHTPPEVGVYR